MSTFYYLISSLPMLELNGPMPMSMDEFLSSCADWISEKELKALTSLSLIPTEAGCNSSFEAICRFNIWELALRNKLYGIRSTKLGRQQAEEGLLGDLDWFSEIESGVQNAIAQTSPVEKERVLDRLRWNYLGDLAAKETFAFGQLVVYKLQLEILSGWEQRDTEKGNENLTQLVDDIYQLGLKFALDKESA